jgi:hypothetical protein
MAQIGISYGGGQPPIIEQLKAQGHTIEDPEKYEQLRENILRLYMAGPLTEAMSTKAMQRLHGLVMRFARPIENDKDKGVKA